MDPCIVRVLLCLCLCFCGFPYIQGKHASIKLKDGHRKQLGACVFPERLPVTIYIEDMTLDINLLVNHEMSAQIPVYIMTERGRLARENLESHPPHRAYKDKEKMAAIVISCIKNNPHKNFILEGRITHNERVYTISPQPDPSRHPRDTNQGHNEYILTIPDIYESTDSNFMDPNSETETLHRNKRESHEQQREVIHREKRAFEAAKYIIDIMIITDYTIYNNFYNQALNPFTAQKRFETIRNIRKYYVAAFNWVNLIYENFPSFDFTIKINVAAIVISENATTSPWTEPVRVGNRVYGMKTLDKMSDWIENNTEVYPEYDHVQLFSRFDFTDDEALTTIGNKGKSYIGSVCTGSKSISYVEELGAFNSADIAAHELGHSFGARHDGFGNGCPVQSSDLMAVVFNPSIARSNKPSICTVQEIKRYMNGMEDFTPECLYDPMPIMSDVPTSTIFPGMEFGVDQQCRQVYGKDSFHCRNAEVEDMNDFCYGDLFCFDPVEVSCSGIVPALGTPCGNKSWCIDTECKYDDRAPERDASCIFGDLPHGYFEIADSGESCAKRVISQPSDCYDDFFSSMCCESCARVRNDKNMGCEYGDRFHHCYAFLCGSRLSLKKRYPYYHVKCCDTCSRAQAIEFQNMRNGKWTGRKQRKGRRGKGRRLKGQGSSKGRSMGKGNKKGQGRKRGRGRGQGRGRRKGK